ncbi:alpha/beta hydrolase-fold protein [Gordonia jinhuaensis]|nr:alpha/beta hydrolase-fold protein [Gordonia jinhuaensis]
MRDRSRVPARRVTAVTALVVGASMVAGVGTAYAANTQAVLRPHCDWVDTQYLVQSCSVYSESMQKYVTVNIRASDGSSTNGERGVYFLDGIGAPADRNTWSYPQIGTYGAYSAQYTLVMPAGGAGSWMTDWNSDAQMTDGTTQKEQWETFLSSELPDYLNTNFGVSTSGNAIVGLSMSGGSALTLAEKHPTVWSVADGTSGFYQTDNPLGWFLIPFIQKYTAGINNGSTAMWGDPHSPTNSWGINDAGLNLAQLKKNGQTAIVSVGIGLPGSLAEWSALLTSMGGDPIATIYNIGVGVGLELGSLVSTVVLNIQAAITGAPVKFVYTFGAHDWTHWEQNLPSDALWVQNQLAALPTVTVVNSDGSIASTTATTTTSTTTTATTDPASTDPASTDPSGTGTEATVADDAPEGTPSAGVTPVSSETTEAGTPTDTTESTNSDPAATGSGSTAPASTSDDGSQGTTAPTGETGESQSTPANTEEPAPVTTDPTTEAPASTDTAATPAPSESAPVETTSGDSTPATDSAPAESAPTDTTATASTASTASATAVTKPATAPATVVS